MKMIREKGIKKAKWIYFAYNNVTSKFMRAPFDIEVTDRQSFIKFMELLHQDYMQNPTEWENSSLDNFLQAMASYAEDIQGYYDNTNQNIKADTPSWKVFADILKGAKIYE